MNLIKIGHVMYDAVVIWMLFHILTILRGEEMPTPIISIEYWAMFIFVAFIVFCKQISINKKQETK